MLLELGVSMPVFCGPNVSHFTSNEPTGGSFGLNWYQDYLSMGSILNSVISWTSFYDCSASTHSVEVAPCIHHKCISEGENTPNGYFLRIPSEEFESKVLEIKASDLLIMSSFLPHRTFVNPLCGGSVKLSLSQRFDDLLCPGWDFSNSYGNSVDRHLFEKRLGSA